MGVLLKKDILVDVSNQIALSKKTTILTHGAFDLFHIGHATMLKKSKKLGDYLIVGVESDERTGIYKQGRPVIPIEQRVEILLENKNVDFVFIHNDNLNMLNTYYIDLYEHINPSIITFGKYFAFKKEIAQRQKIFKNIKFKQISHEFNKVQSTTKILEEIHTKGIR